MTTPFDLIHHFPTKHCKTPAEALQNLDQIKGSAHDGLVENETMDYEIQTRKLSL